MPKHTVFSGKTVLITGASKGVGEQFAHNLAAQGANLVLVARSARALEDLAARLGAPGRGQFHVVPADLADPQAPQAIASELLQRGVEIDLLINNAGMGAVGPFLTRPLKPTLQSVDLNVTALLGMIHEFGPRMLERGQGGIINVGSMAGFQPLPYQASYSGTKAFVLTFTEALAEELRGSGIRVMAAHPGPVQTGFFDSTDAAINSKAVSPEDIAARILRDYARGRQASYPGRPSDRLNPFLTRIFPRTVIARLAGDFNRQAGYEHVTDVA
ncbi:SDR family NAD(P)-dependent oxidoreductase [Kineosporia babensis]|uniref:SDR family oxidoreductase n=1 Tax=Kineosporia babensis TaxID=499548 RepID=A0A9X1N9J3_9ACTN|nr:SDR family oxidoreductase [Kineosporia babensis]MCD5311057.1 SDR family oxidoreductase [Kineosporia babensis]